MPTLTKAVIALRKLCLPALAVVVLGTVCRADDAYVQGVGGTAQMIGKNTQIRMVEEEVTIDNPQNPHVRARFVFHNDGPATDVLIGFPESGTGEGPSVKDARLYNFRSFVDGKPVHVRRRLNEAMAGEYSDWLVKKVHFASEQTRVVVDEYQGGIGRSAGGPEWFTYVLKTGASWKGPIGRAAVTADLGPVAQYSPLVISPAGYQRRGQRVTWAWSDLNPKQDIRISWFPAFLNIEVNGKQPYRTDADESVYNETYAFTPPGQLEQEFWPIRRGNEIWLPAQYAAGLIDAKLSATRPGREKRFNLGSQWVQETVGSGRLTRSDGKVFLMSRAAENQHSADDPTGAMTMIELGPLVRAFGGTAAFNSSGDKYVVTVPKAALNSPAPLGPPAPNNGGAR